MTGNRRSLNIIDNTEQREFEKLEQENLKTVEEVYNSLKEDKEVQAWVEKIKSHEWIKVIEGENV